MKAIQPRHKHTPGQMNGEEAKYAQLLEDMKKQGIVLDYGFEAIKLKLAPNTFYTPDFMVTYPDRIEFHEVKGHWEGPARVKIKVAQEKYYQFYFIAVHFKKGAPTKGRPDVWEVERI
jgi:hypothetical protein